VISFNIDDIHPYDIGTLLDKMGIAVRTGHHCAQPIMDYYKIPGTVRASFAFYNTLEEVDQFVNGVQRATNMLR
jgi:cysteine desulfurase/selenocysteine lyase